MKNIKLQGPVMAAFALVAGLAACTERGSDDKNQFGNSNRTMDRSGSQSITTGDKQGTDQPADAGGVGMNRSSTMGGGTSGPGSAMEPQASPSHSPQNQPHSQGQ